eukprot:m.143308 g.143308  ORF g.143308 m.143308 type:complete len:872 (+) comp17162_c1_seq3:3592-6207(+)
MSVQADAGKAPSIVTSSYLTERDDEARVPLLPERIVGKSGGNNLSTFFGVFVPCVLSIFSVILFLRMGFLVGQAGLLVVLGMFVIAYFVVILTVLSISAISTNGVIKVGGAYFMISRALGPEFGGSIGVIFFFANVFASGLYVAGFVESLLDTFGPTGIDVFPASAWWKFLYGSVVLFLCLAICLVGAKAFSKASLGIFVIVMVSVLSVIISFFAVGEHGIKPPASNTRVPANATLHYTGMSKATLTDNLYPHWEVDYTTGLKQTAFTVFAILFNGCTGIMAGANLSGDLKDASYSIPWGTLQACVFTFVVYVVLSVLMALTCSRDLLLEDYAMLDDINLCSELVIIGTFAATFSAALSTLIGASRVLQALASDNLLGTWLNVFAQPDAPEPVRAVLLSWLLVQCVLFIGSINAIAPIVSMLFLLSYGVVNLACFALRVSGAPNFRPTFRYFSWHTALLGMLSCLAIMFLLQPLYAGVSLCIMVVLFVIIHFRAVPMSWGDISQALIYHQVRKYLLLLHSETNVKYWRPQVLYMQQEGPWRNESIEFINHMKKGGLFIVGKVLSGEFGADLLAEQRAEIDQFNEIARQQKWKAFIDIVMAETMQQGFRSLLTVSGLGGMRPNIVVFELPGMTPSGDRSRSASSASQPPVDGGLELLRPSDGETASLTQMIRDSLLAHKNVGLVSNIDALKGRFQAASQAPKDIPWYIDLWPVETSTRDDPNLFSLELILQMGTILHMVKQWRCCKLRIMVAADHAEQETQRQRIRSLLADVRVDAQVVLLDTESAHASGGRWQRQCSTETRRNVLYDNVFSLMRQHSGRTCVVFSSLPTPPESVLQDRQYMDHVRQLCHDMPPLCLLRGIESVTTPNDVAV